MYNVNSQPIHKVKSKVYIASWDKENSYTDDYGNFINVYKKPQKYMFNVQTLNESVEMEVFGRKVVSSRVISITNKKKYLGKFKEFDIVYVDKEPNKEEEEDTLSPPLIPHELKEGEELEYGDDADYFISGVRNQNTSIRIYLSKLTNEQK